MVPATGDFDLYLYSTTPGLYGKPLILASSMMSGNGQNESISYQSPSNSVAYLVVKRISGSGNFNLAGNMSSQIVILPSRLDFGLLITGATVQATLVISNAGPSVLNGSAAMSNADGFSILSGTPFAMAAQDATNLVIQFAPVTTGNFTNSILFVSENGGSSTNELTGRAIVVPSLLSPAVDQTHFTFLFDTVTGFDYLIQFKDALDDAAWQTVESQTGDGNPHVYSMPTAGLPQRFCRILVQ